MSNQEQLEAIQDIKKLMERSSRFSALSGLSGAIAGLLALISSFITYSILDTPWGESISYADIWSVSTETLTAKGMLMLLNLGILLLLAFGISAYLSALNAKKQGVSPFNLTARRMLLNFSIPLLAGAIYSAILLLQGHIELILPATLLFYGMSMLNAGKYTIDWIRYLGICMIVLGLLGSFFTGYGLLIWTLGFGLLHIVFGLIIYYKNEK